MPPDDNRYRLMEAAFRESEQRLRAIVETAVEGFNTIDDRGAIVSINPAGCRIFGYAPAELTGKNVRMLALSPTHACAGCNSQLTVVGVQKGSY